MLIDCDTCTARGTGCGDCVVTVLLGAPPSWQGTDPVVLGESANTITTYGYDPATGMQEPKVTLCQIRAA